MRRQDLLADHDHLESLHYRIRSRTRHREFPDLLTTTASTPSRTAIAAFIRWRNTRARRKTGFANGAPIRTWTDHPAEGA